MMTWIFSGLLFLQLMFPPDWVVIAPNIQALTHRDVGQQAFDSCMRLPDQSAFTCQVAATNAMNQDRTSRFQAFFSDLTGGNIVGPRALEVFLKYYDLRVTPAPLVTPFGTLPSTPPPAVPPKPF